MFVREETVAFWGEDNVVMGSHQSAQPTATVVSPSIKKTILISGTKNKAEAGPLLLCY